MMTSSWLKSLRNRLVGHGGRRPIRRSLDSGWSCSKIGRSSPAGPAGSEFLVNSTTAGVQGRKSSPTTM